MSGIVNPRTLNDAFLDGASTILADTDRGLSGTQIKKRFTNYAMKYNVDIPAQGRFQSKREYLYNCLKCFDAKTQLVILYELCNDEHFKGNDAAATLRSKLIERYGDDLPVEDEEEVALITETKTWLSSYQDAKKQYDSAIDKYRKGIYDRNVIDDMRLSLESLVRDITGSSKTLEHQKDNIGRLIGNSGISSDIAAMYMTLFSQYTNYQNDNVKHHDSVNSDEVKFMVELTSVMMRLLIRVTEQ